MSDGMIAVGIAIGMENWRTAITRPTNATPAESSVSEGRVLRTRHAPEKRRLRPSHRIGGPDGDQTGSRGLMHRNKLRTWAIAAACLLMVVGAGAVGARAAVEGVTRTGAPPWLGLFGVAIKPDNTIFVVGSKALLLTSNDQGKTWLQRTLKERDGSVLFQDRDL